MHLLETLVNEALRTFFAYRFYCVTDNRVQALLHSYETDPMGRNPLTASKGQIYSATGQRHTITDNLIGLFILFLHFSWNALIQAVIFHVSCSIKTLIAWLYTAILAFKNLTCMTAKHNYQ